VQPFKIGDSVTILDRFSHLYPSGSGVVIAVNPDPFRQLFDEYTLKFPDNSTANVFEFQLIQVRQPD
jgi:hypothetical protein